MRRPVFPNSGPSRAAVIASCRHQLLTSSPAAMAALSTCVCSSSVSLKLTDLVRFASLISRFLSRAQCAHSRLRQCASYTCKLLQRLDQADVYTLRTHHRHASGGVVSRLFRCEAPRNEFRPFRVEFRLNHLGIFFLIVIGHSEVISAFNRTRARK